MPSSQWDADKQERPCNLPEDTSPNAMLLLCTDENDSSTDEKAALAPLNYLAVLERSVESEKTVGRNKTSDPASNL